ncbi:MAG: N-acetylmuramoyl-L-alanine amidase [Myxococcota bacterium]
MWTLLVAVALNAASAPLPPDRPAPGASPEEGEQRESLEPWGISVRRGSSRTRTWVRAKLILPTAKSGPARSLRFAPTPLVRTVAVKRGSNCSHGEEGFTIEATGDTVELALELGPGTEGTLPLGTLQLSDSGETRSLDVQLRRSVEPRERPWRFKTCKRKRPVRERLTRYSPPETCDLSGTEVVLDPGHGPEENSGGYSARGVHEHVFNDALAQEVRRQLKRRGGFAVKLTREGDTDKTLNGRVAKIKRADPDLMVSLHHDSIGDEFRTQREPETQGEAPILSCEDHSGFSLYVNARNPHAARSYHLARRISDRLLASGRKVGRYFHWGQMHRGIYNGDTLFVLRRAQVPAVLVESGFICNYAEETRLGTARHRRRTAALIADGVFQYLVETKCNQAPLDFDYSALMKPSRN